MVEETGTIVAIENDHIHVQTQVKTTCSSCHAHDNCGTSVLAKAFAGKADTLVYHTRDKVQVGQKVKLGIPEQTLLRASANVYMLPLLVLMLSAVAFSALLPLIGLHHELWVVAGSLLSCFASFVWVSARLKDANGCDYQPRLLEILPPEVPVIPVRQVE